MKNKETLTKHWSEQANQARLAELERLTGCPLHKVIEGRCEAEGCQNRALQYQDVVPGLSTLCKRVEELLRSDCQVLEAEKIDFSSTGADQLPTTVSPPKPKAPPKPIIQTRPRMRCVL